MTHNLSRIASALGKDGSAVQSWASDLEILVGGANRVRYPDALSFPRVPHDVFTPDDVEKAKELTSKILQWATSFIN